MAKTLFELDRYTIRRKVLKVFGGAFHIYDGDRVVAYSKQKAFKLKEDIRVYADETAAQEILLVRARQVVDFAAAYDMVDPTDNTVVGTARRKGLRSMMRDSWELMDADGKAVGQLQEDSMGKAMMRRFLSNLIPQTFHLDGAGGRIEMKQHFNPFIYRLTVSIGKTSELDRRLVAGLAVLVAAIEGRQQ